MIKETGLNRVKGKLAGSGGSFLRRYFLFVFCAFIIALYLFPVCLHAQAVDSLSNRIDTISRSDNSARFLLCKWHYTGQNVSGISIIGTTNYYGQNTSGYRINGLELSIDGGAKQLNGVGIGVGLLSPYGTVNGLLFQPFITTASHLRGMAGPCFAIDVDTLDGLAPFSLFATNNRLNGFSAAGFWQASSIANGVVLSGIGHQYDASFHGLAGCGIVGIYDGVFQGVSVSGIGNHFNGNAYGIALSAIYNRASQGFNGVSVSLLRNKSGGQFNGLQVAAICRAKTLSGVQAGLINRSNRLSGIQFGLINIVHSNPKGRRVLPVVNWCFSTMRDTVVSAQKDSLVRYHIYGKDGFLEHDYFLKNGLLHGVERYYMAPDRIEKEISWQNGKKHGWETDNLDPDLTALFWENDSIKITKCQINVPTSAECIYGYWFIEDHANGKQVAYVVRESKKDTMNLLINGVRSNYHFLGYAGRAELYGWFHNGMITDVYCQSPSGKKIKGKIVESSPLNYDVHIIIRERDLFKHDNNSSEEVWYVMSPFFPETCRVCISVFTPSGELLFTECQIKEKNQPARWDNSCRYFMKEKLNDGQRVYYWDEDSVTSYYKNGRLAFRQLLSPGKTTTVENGRVVDVTKSATVYYKNKQCAAYQAKDTLLLYSKRGKPILSEIGDTIIIFRKDGSEMLFYCPEYRRYTGPNEKIVAERFGDSLVKYDDTGKLAYYGLIERDSIWVYAAGDTIPFISGHPFAANLFYIFDRDIESEMEIVFLLLNNKESEEWHSEDSIRLFIVKESLSFDFRWPDVFFEERK